MSAPLRIRQVRIAPLAIPMRLRFEHAAAARSVADPVIVRLSAGAPYAHHVGYGETLARPYVTGETVESVIEDVQRIFARRLAEFEARSLPEALEQAENLPFDDGGRVITAARAAVELAMLDLACRVYRRRAADVARWMELPFFGPPGCIAKVRYAGVVAGPIWLSLQVQRCYGLRDFKIKIAVDGWEHRLRQAHALLYNGLHYHGLTLRADANGGFTYEQVIDALPLLEECRVTALEQPLPEQHDALLTDIAERTRCDLVADESLVTHDDALRLMEQRAVRVWNIRIAKNGGLMPALRLARLAIGAAIDVQLGCLVGETSILSAAGVAFLEACPQVRFAEGAFGRFLLKHDVARRPVRFGFGGRVRMTQGDGLGVEVLESALERLAARPPVTITF